LIKERKAVCCRTKVAIAPASQEERMGTMGIMCRLRRRRRAIRQKNRKQKFHKRLFCKSKEKADSPENHCEKHKLAASFLGAEGST
jgi:hypothetical protein